MDNRPTPWSVQSFLSKEKYIHDKRQPHSCLLVDPDSCLTQKELYQLRNECLRISLLHNPQESNTCRWESAGGFQVVMIVLGRVEDGTTEGVAHFAKTVFEAWELNQTSCQDGVAILIAVEDNQVAYIAGKETEKRLMNHQKEEIIANMKKELERGSVARAVEMGMKVLQPEFKPPTGIFLLLIGLILLAMCHNRPKPEVRPWLCRPSPKGRTHQDRVDNYVDMNTEGFLPDGGHPPVEGQDSCAICLNEFAAESRFETLTDMLNSIFNRTARKDFSSRAATLRCGHRCCNSCLKRWLGSSRQCPLCRRTVSDVSSVVPGRERIVHDSTPGPSRPTRYSDSRSEILASLPRDRLMRHYLAMEHPELYHDNLLIVTPRREQSVDSVSAIRSTDSFSSRYDTN